MHRGYYPAPPSASGLWETQKFRMLVPTMIGAAPALEELG